MPKTQSPRGRASKPEMDFSSLVPVESAEPLSATKAKENNPFIEHVKASVENEKAYSFENLPSEKAGKQAISLLSRAAEILDFGMSTKAPERYKNQDTGKFVWRVRWQAKAVRTKRPRKGAESNGDSSE